MLLNLKPGKACMRVSILGLCFLVMGVQGVSAQQGKAGAPAVSRTEAEQAVINLSKQKWTWMSERNVDSLAALFHEKAVFVHMGGTMSRDQELNVIKTGGIHYKKADVSKNVSP